MTGQEIDLKNIDCMELLKAIPDGSVDLVLTDPPYGMSFQSNARKEKYDKIEGDDNLDWLPEWLLEISRIIKPDGHIYIFCSWHKVDVFKTEIEKLFKIKNLIVWAKNGGGMGDLSGGYGGVHELLFFINNGKPLNGKRDTDVINKAYKTGNIHHPTEKPVNIMRYLIEKSSSPGDLVVDCFVGGGAVPVACAESKRRFKGSEIKQEYFETSMKRIQKALGQTSLF